MRTNLLSWLLPDEWRPIASMALAERDLDHHMPGGPVEPACMQALEAKPNEGPHCAPSLHTSRPGTSAPWPWGGVPAAHGHGPLFAVLRNASRRSHPVEQLFAGLEMLRVLIDEGIDPRGPMPARKSWAAYVAAKLQAWQALGGIRQAIEVFMTMRGVRAGFVQSDVVDALREIQAMDCEIAIAYSPHFRPPSGGPEVPKYTIGGRNGRRVDGLLTALGVIEHGWGPAHGTIIASPGGGTKLSPAVVKVVVKEGL